MVERYRPSRSGSNLGSKLKKPGQRGPGRLKGVPNRITLTLKEALLGSAEQVGAVRPVWSGVYKTGPLKGQPLPDAYITHYEATGQGGMKGYLASMALIRPSSYMALIGKLLPHTLHVDAKVEQTVRSRFEGVDIASKPLSELMVMYREAIGLTQSLPAPDTNARMIEGEAVADTSPTDSTPAAAQAPVQTLPPESTSEPEPSSDEQDERAVA